MKTFKQFCAEAPILKKPTIGKSGTRSGLMGMSSSLPTSGGPSGIRRIDSSGQKFMPGQGNSYGISGIKLAT